jgi:hypothetical protein
MAKNTSKQSKTKTNTNNSDAVKTTSAKWNASSPAIIDVVEYTVNHATSGTRDFLVGQFTRMLKACTVGAMMPNGDDVAKMYALIAAGIKSHKGDSEAYNVNATRNSECAAVLKLYDWQCRDALLAMLKGDEFRGLTFEKLVRIARFLRGTPKQDAAAQKDNATLPDVAKIVAAMNKGSKPAPTGTSNRAKGGVVGMPMNEADRGLAHVVKCLVAFNAKHGKRLADANDRKLLAAMIDNARSLKPAVAALMKADAAEEAKAASK